jgi:hypothetical protein
VRRAKRAGLFFVVAAVALWSGVGAAADARFEKAERALAKERKTIETSLAVLTKAGARPDFPEKSRAAADKARDKLDRAFKRLVEEEEKLQTLRAAEDGKKAERAAQESGLRLIPLEGTAGDVKRIVGGDKTYKALLEAGPAAAAERRVIEACDVTLEGGAPAGALEIDGHAVATLPVSLRMASGRHSVMVKSSADKRPGSFVVVCGTTTRVRLEVP